MTTAPRSPQIRPKVPRILLIVLCIVAVVGLAQCKMTADKVTGVSAQVEMDRNKQGRGNCVEKCTKDAKKALDKEEDKFEKNIKRCRGDRDCINAEKARYKAAKEQIQEDKRHCIEGCHHQGGGRGGR